MITIGTLDRFVARPGGRARVRGPAPLQPLIHDIAEICLAGRLK